MNELKTKSALIILAISLVVFFAAFVNTALAGFPTILSVKGTPNTDGIVVDGLINPNGRPTTLWVEYSYVPNLIPFSETEHIYMNSTAIPSNQSFSIRVPYLSPSTMYFLRVAANNGDITQKTDIFAVKTNVPLPIITPPIQQIVPVILPPVIAPVVPAVDEVEETEPVVEGTETKTALDAVPQEKKVPDFSYYGLSANAISSIKSSARYFLPTTLPNWISFIVLILILIVLIRKLYVDSKSVHHHAARHEKTHERKEAADHIHNLPV